MTCCLDPTLYEMKCLVHLPGWCVSVVAAHDKVVRSYSLESGCWSPSFLLRSVDPELGVGGLV